MLDQILNKESLDENDMKIVMENIHKIPDHHLIRLGLKEAPVSQETSSEEKEEVEAKPKKGKLKE